jgi:cytosine/adenosine deaminase-related metal-dependent hydrolase
VTILMASDGGLVSPERLHDPSMKNSWIAPGEDNLADLGKGQFAWMKAMEEKKFPPMEALKAATRNIAVAYGKEKDLGTLEPGKFADMVVLDRDPLQSAENYRSIHLVIKDGAIVDRDVLPGNPILTKPLEPPSAEVLAYRRRVSPGMSRHPCC